MKTTRTFDFPLRWATPGLVAGLLVLSAVAMAGDFPATGQTTCFDSAGDVIDCAGTGQDGEIQAGATLRLPGQRQRHDPRPEHRAHLGEKERLPGTTPSGRTSLH